MHDFIVTIAAVDDRDPLKTGPTLSAVDNQRGYYKADFAEVGQPTVKAAASSKADEGKGLRVWAVVVIRSHQIG